MRHVKLLEATSSLGRRVDRDQPRVRGLADQFEENLTPQSFADLLEYITTSN